MTIAETIKTLRKTAGMSQEQLAEKLHVSRQAVTKWETEGGTPDIENLRAIAALFGITVDELLTGETKAQAAAAHHYESITEYDIDEVKHYDMKFGSAKESIPFRASGRETAHSPGLRYSRLAAE